MTLFVREVSDLKALSAALSLNNPILRSTRPLPWLVPNLDEKGRGMGMGLSTPPCKTVNATETNGLVCGHV